MREFITRNKTHTKKRTINICWHESVYIILYYILCLYVLALSTYSVMQSDRNSLKIYTFREVITSELIISS